MKNCAVVILNWNGKKLLEQFLPSVVAFSQQATIYIADNASTDDSLNFVTNNYPEVKWIQNKTNSGFAQGYNEALKEVEEEFYVLLNSDVEVTNNWLVPALELFNSDEKIGIIQPKILDFKNKVYFEYAGAAGGFIDKYGYPFCRGRIFDTLEKDTNQYDNEQEIFWASGACFFIRKTVYRELGGFDSDFFAHQEEIDLCWRSLNTGYKTYYTNKSIVYHLGGATLQKSNTKKTFLNFRNSLYMLLKNVPKNKLIGIILVRMILDGIAGLQFLFQGKFSHFVAILKAHGSFYSNWNKMYKKRNHYNLDSYYFVKSVVFYYFFKKIRFFSELFNRKL
ncbi:MAG: GT2 family glycosyltransferase [Flavobacterium sp.]